MTANVEKDGSRHWLVETTVSDGLTGAEAVDVAGASLADAWVVVARACKLSPDELAAVVARRFGLSTCEGVGYPDPVAARLVPESMARKLKAAPLRLDDRRLVVAVSDPRSTDVARQIARAAHTRVEVRVAPPDTVDNWVLQAYATAVSGGNVFYQPGTAGWAQRVGDDADPVTRLTAEILNEAVRQRATDIHVQPFLGGGIVRFRVDGLLRRSMSLPAAAMRRIVNRVKAVAGLDIADPLHPHDGRARLDLGDRAIDLRISTIPVDGAEKMVIRLLGSGKLPVFSNLGFREPERSHVRELLTRREGIAFVTGPTGSGKSTTLQACLALLNRPEYNIVTVENPVEYRVPGLAQIEVAEERGLSYAKALRAILRQDPNLILIGEIRDADTAEIAVESALTGHPVLTTVHTPRAVGVVPRLVELGIGRTLLADAFGGATSQRLMRRLCTSCAAEAQSPLSETEARFAKLTGLPFRRAVGCAACGYTGYHGRVPVAQVLLPSTELRACILDPGATELDLHRVAVESGMRTLAQAAADIVRDGDSTPEEAERALGGSFWTELTVQARTAGIDVSAVSVAVPSGPEPAELQPEQPTVLVVGRPTPRRQELLEQLASQGLGAVQADGVAEARRALVGLALFAAVVLDVDGGGEAVTAMLEGLHDMIGPMGLPLLAVVDTADDVLRGLVGGGRVDAYVERERAATLADQVRATLEKRAASLDTGAAFLDFLEALPES
jgi:type II secretory ATPase GspE/PulE/Tfp pilus assembly ATPase PilB-like protein